MKAPFSPPDPLDEDPVWRLLERAPLTSPHGWLAAQTLARCRREGGLGADRKAGFAPGWWRLMFGGLLSAGVALVLVLAPMPLPSPNPTGAPDVQQAFNYIASLSTETESTPWPDSSSP